MAYRGYYLIRVVHALVDRLYLRAFFAGCVSPATSCTICFALRTTAMSLTMA